MPDTIQAFLDVPEVPMPQDNQTLNGLDYLNRVAGMQVGQGSKVMRVDESGLWLGAAKFVDAPFSVDMNGNLVASTATFGQYLSKTGTSQVLSGDYNVGIGAGGSSVKVDGANNRIIIHDGTTNRIVIGNV